MLTGTWLVHLNQSPLRAVEAWPHDLDEDEIRELRQRLLAQDPPNPEWKPSHQYPRNKWQEPKIRRPDKIEMKAPPGWEIDRWQGFHTMVNHWDLPPEKIREIRTWIFKKSTPFYPEWKARHQYPRAYVYIGGDPGYWDKAPQKDITEMSPRQRYQHEARLERQRVFLTHLRAGKSIVKSAQETGVTLGTVTTWRHKYREFGDKVDRVRMGLAPSERINDSFITRRQYYFGFESYPHHREIIDAIEDTPEGGITIILLPPEAGKPVDVEAPIQMADGTVRRLGDIEVGDWVVSHKGRPRPVSKMFEQGHLSVTEIRTGLGRSVVAALDHPFLTDRGWVEAGDLTTDDVLKVPAGYYCVSAHTPDTMKHRLAGYLVGDGMCRSKVAVTNNNPDLLADIETIGKQLGFKVKMESNGRPFPGGEQSWNAILNNGARDLAKAWGLFNHTAHTKRVPEFVFRATDEGVAAFLAAYFACDGSVAPSRRRSVAIEVASVNRALCDDTQRLLARLGIRSRIAPHQTIYRGEPHLSWRVTIGKKWQAAAKFIDAILPHLHHGPKRERLEAWRLRMEDATAKDLYDDPVVGITNAGVRECRCLTVDIDHTFLASDLVVRNTTLLEDWCSDKIAQDPNVRILYVSEAGSGQSPAAKVLGAIKERLTDPDREDPEAPNAHLPEWHAKYGPFRDNYLDKDKPWNSKYIKVHKASGRRDYTFQAVSWNSSIYGARTDWLVFDDVQSRKNINLTETMLTNIRTTFLSRPGRKGKTVFIGTRVGVGDVYERLVDELPERLLRLVQIPAVDGEGNSYCPEMWPEQALEDKRAIVGEQSWSIAYMMQPRQAEATTFTSDMLDEARNPNLGYGMLYHAPTSLVLAGLDPALGGGNAVVVAETTRDTFNLVAIKVDYGLARNERILEILREMCRHGYHELAVERNSQQQGLARDERLKELSKEFGFKIVEHQTGGNKWDYQWGVSAMASSFIKGEINFPDKTPESRKRMEPLRAELEAWRPDVPTRLLRQDLVMALWFAWMVWQKRRGGSKVRGERSKGWKTGGTPWKPGDMSGKWRKGKRGLLVPST